MSIRWTLSPDLRDLISKKMNENGPAGLGTDFYPSILWSLGGEIRRGSTVENVAPHYALGWVKSSDLGRFASIEHGELGFIAFQPSKSDENMSDGVIDIDETGIHVKKK